VNLFYASPPESTEQILHPKSYPDDHPLPVTLPDLKGKLPPDCRLVETNVFGEWYLYLILAFGDNQDGRLMVDQAKKAAEGWGGDRYQVYTCPNGSISMLSTRWDSPEDLEEYWESLNDYGLLNWGIGREEHGRRAEWLLETGEKVILAYNDAEVLWLKAPDEATARLVMEEMPVFEE
jgi:hypothetical protein